MLTQFTPLTAWSDYPLLSRQDLLEQLPALREHIERADAMLEDEEWGHFLELYDNDEFILLSGDIRVTAAQMAELRQEYRKHIVVEGSIDVEGEAKKFLYVSGNLHCQTIWLCNDDYPLYVDGRVIARHCAKLYNYDDGGMRIAPEVRLETPFLFSWFGDIDNLELCPTTAVVILANWKYCSTLDLPNPVFAWHDCMYVLNDDYLTRVCSDGSDEESWNLDAIEEALARGKSLYRQGYDLTSYPWQKAADLALEKAQHERAFLLYRKAASLSPETYPAWYGMGEALFASGALTQAMECFVTASAVFPLEQFGMVNMALNMASLCALHSGRYPLAFDLATRSIEHNAVNEDLRTGFALAYRLRAEALMLMGCDDEALMELQSALDHDKYEHMAMWLKGKILFRKGELAAAADFHLRASRNGREPLPSYDEAETTASWSEAPRSVDWQRRPLTMVMLDEPD